MSKKKNSKSPIRTALLASLRADVTALVERGDSGDSGLDSVLETVGYHCIVAETNKNIGRAIAALAPMLDLDVLASVAHAAAFHRVIAGYYHDAITINPDVEAIPRSRGEKSRVWKGADDFANSTLARIDGELLARFLARLEPSPGAASAVRA